MTRDSSCQHVGSYPTVASLHHSFLTLRLPMRSTDPSQPLTQIQFPSSETAKITVHSPNIYNLASKKLPPPKPSITSLTTSQMKKTKTPTPFPPSLLALSPDQLSSQIQRKFEQEEIIPVPAKEAIGKTMYPRSFACAHSTASMLDDWGRTGCPAANKSNADTNTILIIV